MVNRPMVNSPTASRVTLRPIANRTSTPAVVLVVLTTAVSHLTASSSSIPPRAARTLDITVRDRLRVRDIPLVLEPQVMSAVSVPHCLAVRLEDSPVTGWVVDSSVLRVVRFLVLLVRTWLSTSSKFLSSFACHDRSFANEGFLPL